MIIRKSDLICIIALLSISTIASAQTSESFVTSPKGITVLGHADVKTKPDIARVTLSISTQSRDQTDAVQTNATKVSALMQVLSKSAIASKDIQTQYYTVQPTYDYNVNPPLLTGYTVTNALDVTIRDIPKAGLILDKATRAGATSADGLSFDLEDKNKVISEALAAAVANARSKADLVAGAGGVELGRLVSITESNTAQPPIFQPRVMAMSQVSSAPTTSISPQLITVSEDVTATFEINYKLFSR